MRKHTLTIIHMPVEDPETFVTNRQQILGVLQVQHDIGNWAKLPMLDLRIPDAELKPHPGLPRLFSLARRQVQTNNHRVRHLLAPRSCNHLLLPRIILPQINTFPKPDGNIPERIHPIHRALEHRTVQAVAFLNGLAELPDLPRFAEHHLGGERHLQLLGDGAHDDVEGLPLRLRSRLEPVRHPRRICSSRIKN